MSESTCLRNNNTSVTISFVGDLLCLPRQIELAYNPISKTYDFSSSFSHVKKYFKNSDYVVGNLEMTLAGAEKKYTHHSKDIWYSRQMFNTPDEYAKTLKETGFNLLTTANNHCLDRGTDGLLRTLDVLDKYGLDHIGTYSSQTERDTIFIKEINGVKIAFLNYTFGINYQFHKQKISGEKAYHVNMLSYYKWQVCKFDTIPCGDIPLSFQKQLLYAVRESIKHPLETRIKESVLADIKKAKSLNPDLTIVIPHMGIEWKKTPDEASRDFVDAMFHAGADVIIGHHPHVLQPMEFRTIENEDKTTRIGFVAYSLGNFITSKALISRNEARKSVILNLHVNKDSENKISFSSISIIPTWVHYNDLRDNLLVQTIAISDILSHKDKEKILEVGELKNIQNSYSQIICRTIGKRNISWDMDEVYYYPSDSQKSRLYFILSDLSFILKRLYIMMPIRLGIKFLKKIYMGIPI